MNKIEEAYDWLLEQIDNGMEFPEALARAAYKFGVSGQAIKDMYDADGR